MTQYFGAPAATMPAVLAAVAAARPEHPFVVAEDGAISYGSAAADAARIAAGLRAIGLQPGERIGILLSNGMRWCVSYLAAHAAGLTAVPLNTWYRADALQAVAARASLRAIVSQDELFGQPTARSGTRTITWNPGASRPTDLPDCTVDDPLLALRDAQVEETDDALILFTSGSSAEPKGVRLTHAGVVRTAYEIGERQGVVATDRFWFGSPLFFVYGCSNAIPNAMTHGATLCVQERFEADSALEFIERNRCTVYYGVAPITRALATSPDLAGRDISSLRLGTSVFTPEDLRLAIEVLGISDVCNAYGLTEGHGHTTITHHTDPSELRMRCQGTVLPTQELRIVVDGSAVGPDEPGEIQIRGLITPGYLDGEESSAQGFTADGWFRTGDLGRLDAEGRLTYLGRNHELMKVKGINVSPLEIEGVLVQHPDIDEAFVFGVPTQDGDEQIACVLVGPRVDAQAVRAWLGERLAPYQVPSIIRIIAADAIPLTATGKASKRLMRDLVVG